ILGRPPYDVHRSKPTMSILGPVSQRRTIRRAVRVDCQVVGERDFKLLGEGSFGLSPDGMLVATSHVVLTGEELIASFSVPRTRVIIDAPATVARVVHGRRPTDRHRR